MLTAQNGSSPHTRGAPSRTQPGRGRCWDHPRIRGEHDRAQLRALGECGSSPHTRGARLREAPRGGRRWIIPAYAGSTRFWQFLATRSRDHPRIRGEHRAVSTRGWRKAGSSPHTRGALRQAHGALGFPRIIPAYAGSTRSPCRRTTGSAGSSPHTRGAQEARRPRRRESRIIPAYAGSTWRTVKLWSGKRDHPRIRGEHTTTRYNAHKVAGSSPHTRGALYRSTSSC